MKNAPSATEKKKCPFCRQPISPSQYNELRDRIRKAEDPVILRELEGLRQDLSQDVKNSLELEYAPLKKELDSFHKREKELSEQKTQLTIRESTLETEVLKRISKKEKELIATGAARAKEEFEATSKEKDGRIKDLTKQLSKTNEEIQSQVAVKLAENEEKVREDEKKRAEAKYAPLQRKVTEYQQKALALEQLEQTLALKEQGLELEVNQRMAKVRDDLIKQASRQALQTYGIEIKEKDGAIQKLREEVNHLQERLQLGSAQARGYIQQQELAETLKALYHGDEIEEIKRGEKGADVFQKVCLPTGGVVGSILWESKRTKDFHPSWMDKLREDQRSLKADVAVIVSQVLPEGVEHFSVSGDVLIMRPDLLDSISAMLRQHLINLARQRMTSEQRETKIHELYSYMTGKEFQQRISGIVDAASELEDLVNSEIRSHERLWGQRKKLHERVFRQSALLYGEVSGIAGTLPPVKKLELPASTEQTTESTQDEDIPF